MAYRGAKAFCLDSQQLRLFWFDDFLGDSLSTLWAESGDSGGSADVVDGTGGILRITTDTTDNDEWMINWNDIESLIATKRLIVEVRMKLGSTSNIRGQITAMTDPDNQIYFRYDTDTDTNWMIKCEASATETLADSGVAPDTNYHIFRFDCHTHGGNHVHFYIDGTETSNSPISTNVPTTNMEIEIKVFNRATGAHTMDVDYVAIEQDR